MKKHAGVFGFLIAAAGVGAGCAGSPSGSCMETGVVDTAITGGISTTVCAEYASGYSVNDAMVMCSESVSGQPTATATYSSGPCTATGRVGRCRLVSADTGAVFIENFYTGDATMLMNACISSDGTDHAATWQAN